MATIRLHLKDETETALAGADIAMGLSASSLLFLQGDLGAGKTCLARAIIRHLSEDDEMDVPSPTFSLVQEYVGAPTSGIETIIHCDLYRISEALEIDELNIIERADRLIMIEWSDNAKGELGAPDLTLSLIEKDDGRELIIEGDEAYIEPISRSLLIRKFLQDNWAIPLKRQKFFGDASTRTYEFAIDQREKYILMNAPKQSDGPIIQDGKPYSQLAHLAEDVSAFVGVQQILKSVDLSAPIIHAEQLDEGLLLLENFGTLGVLTQNRAPIEERYLASVEMLAHFHQKNIVFETALKNGETYKVPDYSHAALIAETQLLPNWYMPYARDGDSNVKISVSEHEAFNAIWRDLTDLIETSEKHLVLRDFHSPNIIWLPEREGIQQVGLIDFQDAVIGPTAYDVASLAQDARVDISQGLEDAIVDHYIKIRNNGGAFDETRFRQDYATMAAQRATKILGIFVRLDQRDNKPAYLTHLPRMQDYIKRSLKHPILRDYKEWFETTIKQ